MKHQAFFALVGECLHKCTNPDEMKTTSRPNIASTLVPPTRITKLSMGVCLLAMLLAPGIVPGQEADPATDSPMGAESTGDGPLPDPAPAPGPLEVVGTTPNPAAIRFTPPPPPKPAPQVVPEAVSVLRKPTHTITFLRGEPSTLPDIPPPPERIGQPATDPVPPRRPDFLLGLSVSVYDGALSHLKWRDPQTKEELEAWCGWDWGLLAPMQTVSNDRVVYTLFFSPWNVDTARRDASGRRQPVPDHPPVGANEFVLTVGNADAPSGKPLLEAVRLHCVANRPELEQLRAARDQYRADAEAWKKANPTRPRSHTIALRPHRGSRYLIDRTPAGETGETATGEDAR